MHELLIILIVASLMTYVIGLLKERARGLVFLSFILATCSFLAIVQARVELGDSFLIALVPMLYVMLMSIAHLITKGPE